MKLYGVRIWVDDLAAARRFYAETLGLAEKWAWGSAIGYDLGAELIVEQDGPRGPNEASMVGRFAGVSISVEDIQAAYERLTGQGVVFLAPPEKMPWGGTLAHFKDPAGNTLTLIG